MSPEATASHKRYRQAVSKVAIAQALDSFVEPELNWTQIHESWMQVQSNGKATPWDRFGGSASGQAEEMKTRHNGIDWAR